LPLLKALNNHGPTAASFPKSWHSGGLGYQGVNYNIGPSPDSLQLNLFNKQEYVTTPIWNAIGVINGTLEDEVVVIGNHRDAWILGGAGDPNSGSAILNECVRAFGKALAAGWKPQRTIVFASWDGEEYGLLGSTEWVEEYLPWLSSSAVAYINLDTAASGPELVVASTPNFEDAIGKVLREVQSPDQSTPGQTVHDVWNGEVDLLGSGSDFTAFLDFAGVSSIHIGFEAGEGSPVYQYHSNYDSFHWMEKFGDPGFKYHVALAQVTNLLAAKFIEEPIISFEAHTYSNAISGYLGSINKTIDKLPHKISTEFSDAIEKIIPSFLDFRNATDHHDTQAQKLSERLNANPHPELIPDLFLHARVLNQRYKQLERQFLDDGGLEGRNWFKHTIYAPGLWTGYAAVALPGLSEALDNRNLTAFKRAAEVLVGQFEAAKHLLWPEQYP
jgi:N-acetylated-alpha-linked acidic dipeptidase